MKAIVTKVDVRSHTSKTEKDRMYIFHDGESMVTNLYERFDRPHEFYKKDVLPLVMDEIKKTHPKHYEELQKGKWGWRQYSGCACGCSPGFVSTTKNHIEIFVNIKITE